MYHSLVSKTPRKKLNDILSNQRMEHFVVLKCHCKSVSHHSSRVCNSSSSSTMSIQSLRLCLCLALLHIATSQEFIYEKVLAKPTSVDFEKCNLHSLGTSYACWVNSALSFHVETADILEKWPTHASECCAVWAARDCLDLSKSHYEPCKVPEVAAYYQQVWNKYSANGCEQFTHDKFNCTKASHYLGNDSN